MRGNCREDGTQEILQETTKVFAELFSEEAAVYFLEGWQQTGPSENMFFPNGSKARMIRVHVSFPFLNYWQIITLLKIVEEPIFEPGELLNAR